MENLKLTRYAQVWAIDFEFQAPAGENPLPVCLVAHDIVNGHTLRYWREQLREMNRPPFSCGADSLLLAYYASAEIGCFLSLGWEPPKNVIDLFAEFRVLTNGKPGASTASLLGALSYFDLDCTGAVHKEEMRQLVLRGGPWSPEEQIAILHYCESDVKAVTRLWHRMLPHLYQHSLLRGRYMVAAARMEANGVPIDTHTLGLLRENWDCLKRGLVNELDHFHLYEGTTFKLHRFCTFLKEKGWGWPLTEKGKLSLTDDTFREMCALHPEMRTIHELRYTLSQLKLNDLAVGTDGRNRCLLSAFRAKSGRNQPSTSKFIFGPSTWIRSLIKPAEGMAVVYVDWAQQEFGIAAALSGDTAMQQAYLSGDPYLEFAKLAKAVPANATKESHPGEREQFKQTLLAVNYMMGAESLSVRIKGSCSDASRLLSHHRRLFPQFWRWSEAAVDYASLNGCISTRLGWNLCVNGNTKVRTIQNFPMQGNGAEMLRLACCLATERGVKVCAPVHDALLFECSASSVGEAVFQAQRAMREAAEIILDGFPLRSEAALTCYPDRYVDKRGRETWKAVMKLLSGMGYQNRADTLISADSPVLYIQM